jgi:hypothetical protein
MKLPATASTTAATALATTPSASTTAASPFRLRPSFVDIQRASTNLGAIQCSDRFLSVLGACHLDKAEAARASSIPVRHDADAIDLSVYFEKLAQFLFRCVEIQVSNKDVLQASASGVSYLSVCDFGREAGGASALPGIEAGVDEQSNAEEV